MICASCANPIERKLNKRDGVTARADGGWRVAADAIRLSRGTLATIKGNLSGRSPTWFR
ncbi:heavy-metal-associated domain-containing protein [Nonomuraea sp. 3N208]|uniref:heavy-metal-associated domain-containing protein n=1 Tax=Nonomuraea sp. 3N208 TaxID=3457421 RepID=UPI003FD6BB35